MKLQASGWPLILLSRKSQRQQNATVGHLISAGYSGWTSLIMRYCCYVPFFKPLLIVSFLAENVQYFSVFSFYYNPVIAVVVCHIQIDVVDYMAGYLFPHDAVVHYE